MRSPGAWRTCRVSPCRPSPCSSARGCGGGALALLPAGRVIAAEHAWLSPLPPEGASAIVYHDTEHAPLLAERQRISAFDLLDDGIVHAVVPEEPAAHEDPRAFVRGIVTACASAICEFTGPAARPASPIGPQGSKVNDGV